MAKSRRPVTLVTGAANGIGRAVTQRLLDTGWSVGAIDLPKSGLSRVFGRSRHAMLLEGDVADEKTAPAAIEAILDQFGRLDGMVSNAGITIRKAIRHLTLRDW